MKLHGFRCRVKECLKGPRGGRSSGVGFLWKPWLQVIRRPVCLVEGRVQHMAIRHPKLGEFHFYNVYSAQAGSLKARDIYQLLYTHT